MFIDVSFENWVILLFFMVVSGVAGVSLSLFMPWTLKSYQSTLPLNFGIALSPFILGAGAVLSLGLFQGYSHNFHLYFVIILLLFIGGLGIKKYNLYLSQIQFNYKNLSVLDYIILLCLFLWIFSLLINVLYFPVTKNDSLEYVTVGKVLYDSKSLLSYPVIDSLKVSSGFYAPWTHPPLYVALIYIMDVIQSDVNHPIFAKLISPWFAVGSLLLMYEIGAIINKKAGLLIALIFLSCPLYFLGASDSLIDPLPVAGMILILCSTVFFKHDIIPDFLAKGLILAISLWTHSEAILFIPLMFVAIMVYNGIERVRYSISVYSLSLSLSLLIALYPYARNYMLFNSLISDTPRVFSLPQLDWASYFQLNRGYFTLLEKIQFGILKGWFVIDAYSLTYWLTTLGISFFVYDLYKSKTLYKLPSFESPIELKINLTFLCVFICYICGVILSILLDIDLMIRNERYLLIMLPVASYFAGKAIYQIIAPKSQMNS